MHERVMSVRAWVQWALRALGVAMVLVGILMMANSVLYGALGTGDIKNAWGQWTGVGRFHGVFLGVPLGAVGAAVAWLAPVLARWTVRPPERGCAACGHEDLDDSGRCNECGRV